MSSDAILVTVIIPVYNGELFVRQAIESVLRQEHAPLELVVVDDGSTDKTAALVQSFGDDIRYVYQANGGPASARNHGLQLACGQMIAFLDADDVWADGKLATQIERLKTDETLDIALSHTQFVRSGEGGRLIHIGAPCLQALLGCALFRRSAFDRVGQFDQSLYYCDDWDWFMRARELGISMQMHPEVTLYYRRHENNITLNPQSKREFLGALRKSLSRRRKRGRQAVSLPAWFSRQEVYERT